MAKPSVPRRTVYMYMYTHIHVHIITYAGTHRRQPKRSTIKRPLAILQEKSRQHQARAIFLIVVLQTEY